MPTKELGHKWWEAAHFSLKADYDRKCQELRMEKAAAHSDKVSYGWCMMFFGFLIGLTVANVINGAY